MKAYGKILETFERAVWNGKTAKISPPEAGSPGSRGNGLAGVSDAGFAKKLGEDRDRDATMI